MKGISAREYEAFQKSFEGFVSAVMSSYSLDKDSAVMQIGKEIELYRFKNGNR